MTKAQIREMDNTELTAFLASIERQIATETARFRPGKSKAARAKMETVRYRTLEVMGERFN